MLGDNLNISIYFKRGFMNSYIEEGENMSKDQILRICDNLVDQLTVLKGFIQLDKMNNKIDHSIVILKEVDNLEKIVIELVNQLIADE